MRNHQYVSRFAILTISTVLILLPFGVYASDPEKDGTETVSENGSISVNEAASGCESISIDETVSESESMPLNETMESIDTDGQSRENEKAVSDNTSESGTISENTVSGNTEAESEQKEPETVKTPEASPEAPDPKDHTKMEASETEKDADKPEIIEIKEETEQKKPEDVQKEKPKTENIEKEKTGAEETRIVEIKTEKTGTEEQKPEEKAREATGGEKIEEIKIEERKKEEKKEEEQKPKEKAAEEQKKDTRTNEKNVPIRDEKKPEIRITGVEDRSANRRPLRIIVEFRDEHLAKESAYARITATNSGKKTEGVTESETQTSLKMSFPEITEDDYYVLEAGCRDAAGNEKIQKISFTENQKGAVTALKNVALKDSSVNEKKVVPEFHVSGIDELTEVRADVNGQNVPVQFNKEGNLVLKDPLTKEGEYTVQVTTRDASGNEVSSAPVSFEIDRTKPKIAMKKAKEEGKKSESYEVVISKDQQKDRFTEVLLDGRKLEKEEYTTSEDGSIRVKVPRKGKHTVRATAKDAAGNTKTYSKHFEEGSDTDRSSSSHAGAASVILIAAGGAAAFFRRFLRKS